MGFYREMKVEGEKKVKVNNIFFLWVCLRCGVCTYITRGRFHRGSLEAYVSSAEVIGSEKFQLEPPEGFTDTLGSKTQKSGESGGGTVGGGVASEGGSGGKAKQGGRVQMKAGNEYAIAV